VVLARVEGSRLSLNKIKPRRSSSYPCPHPLAAISTVATPQTRPVPGRADQVRNNAGGFVFAKDLWTQLEDFLILGTTGGTYYLGEDKLTADNADVVFQAVREDGPRAVALIVDVSTSRPPRAPKNRPCLFALAAASAMGDPATVQAVKTALPLVARTTDHLSMFFGYRKQLKGKAVPGGTAPVASRAYPNVPRCSAGSPARRMTSRRVRWCPRSTRS
jgi:60 kDa SS-A/Ro ribonucleoprotein